MKAAFSLNWIGHLGDEIGQFLRWLCYGVCSKKSFKKEMLVLGAIFACYIR